MTPPTSKLPFLNCITDVLLMHVPSGKMRIGGFFGFDTWSFSRWATAWRSLDSARSNQMCGEARLSAFCRTPKKPPCRWPIYLVVEYFRLVSVCNIERGEAFLYPERRIAIATFEKLYLTDWLIAYRKCSLTIVAIAMQSTRQSDGQT